MSVSEIHDKTCLILKDDIHPIWLLYFKPFQADLCFSLADNFKEAIHHGIC